MTAAGKRKYFYSALIDACPEIKMFQSKGYLWKIASDKSYAIRIQCDLSSWGDINAIDVGYGSVFAPTEKSGILAYSIGSSLPNTMFFASFARSIDAECLEITRDPTESFLCQTERLIPIFKQHMAPYIEEATTFEGYMKFAQRAIDISHRMWKCDFETTKEEMIWNYLSLNDWENALQTAEKWVFFCNYVADQYVDPLVFEYVHLDMEWRQGLAKPWREKVEKGAFIREKILSKDTEYIKKELENHQNYWMQYFYRNLPRRIKEI